MSELLQDDDPDPQPSAARRYPINYQTELAYEDDGLASELAHLQEIEDIHALSMLASRLLEGDLASGPQTNRQLQVGEASLRRHISDGAWKYVFEDCSEEGVARCRAWRLGGDSVSWCKQEQRHEPAHEVMERLAATFIEQPQAIETKRSLKHRLERIIRGIGRSSLTTSRAS
jgi:hypothetical protein